MREKTGEYLIISDPLIAEAHEFGIDMGWHKIGVTPVDICGCSACTTWRMGGYQDSRSRTEGSDK
jgi:hypothetical protein